MRVFEDGCEAAAVTAIDDRTSAADDDEKIYDMKVNRPFLFLLINSKLPVGYDLVFMSKIEKFDNFYKIVGQEGENDEDDEEINDKNKSISNELLIIIIAIGDFLIFSLIGLVIWKKIKDWKRKERENQLIDDLDI